MDTDRRITTDSSEKTTAVDKALAILEAFCYRESELSLASLSKLLNIPKTTLVSPLRTLEKWGYLYRIPASGNYQLGYKAMQLNYHYRNALPILQYAKPILRDLQEKTGEIIYMVTHVNGQIFYLDCAFPSRIDIAYSTSGKTLLMHNTGSGKGMLANLPQAEVDAILDKYGLPYATPNTITDRGELMKELAKIREKGYSYDNGEESHNAYCISMPILDDTGIAVGAVSVSGSVVSMGGDKRLKYLPSLSHACQLLSQYNALFPVLHLPYGSSLS